MHPFIHIHIIPNKNHIYHQYVTLESNGYEVFHGCTSFAHRLEAGLAVFSCARDPEGGVLIGRSKEGRIGGLELRMYAEILRVVNFR
eukprot:1373304-Amorphochlora_amoeboformis.AAC.1